MEQLAAILGVPIESVVASLGATVGGFAVHVLLKVADIREKDDSSMTLTRYFSKVPYKTTAKLLTVIGSAVILAAPEISLTSLAGAAGIGYAADSATNHASNS